jgi:phage recombination protein Bet
MSNIVIAEASKLAKRFQIDASPAEIVETRKATAFKGQVTDAQMAALMLFSAQYGLNPWTKEIYGYPDKNNGIVPVVGVDGWSRIINSHEQFDGMEFEQDEEKCTCIIYRKDRSHPIKVTEYMAECKRQTGPWQSHPRRMLRHKAMIQCARLAFGFAGIYDQDEAERIVESIDAQTGEIVRSKTAPQPARPALEPYPADKFDANLPAWRELIQSGRKTADDIIAMVTSRATLTDAQIQAIRNCAAVDVDATEVTE